MTTWFETCLRLSSEYHAKGRRELRKAVTAPWSACAGWHVENARSYLRTAIEWMQEAKRECVWSDE